MSGRSQLFILWWSMVFTAIFGLSLYCLIGFVPPPPADLDVTAVARLYAEHNMRIRIGVVICLITGAFLMPWSLVISVQMERLEQADHIWSKLQRLSGTIGALIFVLPVLFWGVAAFSANRNPEITMLMHETAFLTLVTPVSFFFFQQISLAVVVLQQKNVANSAFPRWLGWLTIWFAFIIEVGVLAQLFKAGPFAWNGIFTFWLPIGLFGIWFTIINVVVIAAIKKQIVVEQALAVAG